MHIPSTMLNATICPTTIAISGLGIAIAVLLAKRSDRKPTTAMFAAMTALIFALQMLNYPIQNDISGHMIGSMLAVAMLGTPFAVLSISVVLFVQAFFFGDGGVNALGANILNMSLIGAGALGCFYSFLRGRRVNEKIALFIAAFFSVLAAAFSCTVEIALSGAVSFYKALPAMLSVHALIGIGESVLSVFALYLLQAQKKLSQKGGYGFASATFILAVLAVFISPFASAFPDGLEWIAKELSFVSFSGFEISVPFPSYQATFLGLSSIFSTIIAGISGLFITFGCTASIGKIIKNSNRMSA